MPTCETPFPSVSKKTRSPSRSAPGRSTAEPVENCCLEPRGMSIDTSRYEFIVSPEQSIPRCVRPPQTQGVPGHERTARSRPGQIALGSVPVLVLLSGGGRFFRAGGGAISNTPLYSMGGGFLPLLNLTCRDDCSEPGAPGFLRMPSSIYAA